MSSPRRSRHLRRTIVPAMACASLLVSVAHLWLAGATTGRITDDAADVRAAPVALVFGAGLEVELAKIAGARFGRENREAPGHSQMYQQAIAGAE